MALEGPAAVAWAYAQLAADTGAGGFSTLLGGRIYRDQVPQTAALPAAVLTLVSHTDQSTLGGRRVFAAVALDVHLIGDGVNYGPLETAGLRADTVLQNAGGANGGTTVVELVRTDVRAYVENDSGKSYSHLILSYGTPAYT